MTLRSSRRLLLIILAVLFFPAIASAEVGGPPDIPRGTIAERLHSLVGLALFTLLAWAIGRATGAKARVPTRTIVWGTILQLAFGGIVVWNRWFLKAINDAVDALLGFTRDGAKLVFGDLVWNNIPVGTPGQFSLMDPIHPTGMYASAGAYFVCFVLPTIIFFSCLTAVAYHSGIMQYVVQGFAWIMSKSMGTSGAETLSSAANIFVGQTEAPLMVKPFVAVATNSELMAIMVGGFANIASGVLGLYSIWLQPFVQDAAGHLAAACLITAPGSLLVAKLLVPETEKAVTAAGVEFKVDRIDANLVDAAARGTTDGLGLAINVGAMLISFTALVALFNALLSSGFGYNPLARTLATHPIFHHTFHLRQIPTITLQDILGFVFRPLAWLTGVSWSESKPVGTLLGIKTVLNELIAYSQMKDALTADPTYLSPRSRLLATYALCGFANFASVGIQVGGISTLAPNRRADLSRIGMLAMVGGAICSLMAACVIGILY
jgi:CNT family concentrative nucleoside transporter